MHAMQNEIIRIFAAIMKRLQKSIGDTKFAILYHDTNSNGP